MEGGRNFNEKAENIHHAVVSSADVALNERKIWITEKTIIFLFYPSNYVILRTQLLPTCF